MSGIKTVAVEKRWYRNLGTLGISEAICLSPYSRRAHCIVVVVVAKEQTGALRNIPHSHSDLYPIAKTTWIAMKFLPYFRLKPTLVFSKLLHGE